MFALSTLDFSTGIWPHIWSVVGLIVTTIVVPKVLSLLKNWSTAAAAVEDNASMDRKGMLLTRIKTHLAGTAAMIAEREFPELARKIAAGELSSKDKIKDELYRWGDLLKQESIKYWNGQGIDLATEIGPEAIDNLVIRAANAVSPFPGKETATALLEGGAKQLLDKGIQALRVAVSKGE